MGRNSLILGLTLSAVLPLSGCKSGDAGPSPQQLAEQAHHGIDVKKMSEHQISMLPKPAQDAIRAELAQGNGKTSSK